MRFRHFSRFAFALTVLILAMGCGRYIQHVREHTGSSSLDSSKAAAPAGLRSGPMVGHVDIREAHLWAQTTAPAKVEFVYYKTGLEEFRPDDPLRTPRVWTQPADACVAQAVATGLEPDTTYAYEVWVDDTLIELPYPAQFRTPQFKERGAYTPADFTVATGSCYYRTDPSFINPARAYGGEYEIFTAMAEQHPDIMLWLGDNWYYTNADWGTRTGMIDRASFSRELPELGPLLAASHNYAIWDDHDFGPNNSNRAYWMKNTAQEVFELFWANPSHGVMDHPGVTTSFEWEDAQFFLLDNRYFRVPNERAIAGLEDTQLGLHQREWLIDALASSTARFKVVAMGGQFVTEWQEHETYANYHPAERRWILDKLEANRIEGVIFLSGDRHFSETSRLERPGAYPLLDFTISPLTSGAFTNALESQHNAQRIEGSGITVRNFAMMRFSGPADARTMTIEFFDSTGKPLWEYTVAATDLRYPRD